MKLDELFSHWRQVRADLLATIDKFAEEELAVSPGANTWPAGQIMLHIANAEEGWFRYVVTSELEEWPADYRLDNYPTKKKIKDLLTDVHLRTEHYLAAQELTDLNQQIPSPWSDSLSLNWIIWHVIEHEIHHRGELSLMLGLLGRDGLEV